MSIGTVTIGRWPATCKRGNSMAIASPRRPAPIRSHGEGGPGLPVPLLRFAGFVLVVACLYWAQIVLIPVALALLLTFMLAPVVSRLERWRVPRALAVVAVVLLGSPSCWVSAPSWS